MQWHVNKVKTTQNQYCAETWKHLITFPLLVRNNLTDTLIMRGPTIKLMACYFIRQKRRIHYLVKFNWTPIKHGKSIPNFEGLISGDFITPRPYHFTQTIITILLKKPTIHHLEQFSIKRFLSTLKSFIFFITWWRF